MVADGTVAFAGPSELVASGSRLRCGMDSKYPDVPLRVAMAAVRALQTTDSRQGVGSGHWPGGTSHPRDPRPPGGGGPSHRIRTSSATTDRVPAHTARESADLLTIAARLHTGRLHGEMRFVWLTERGLLERVNPGGLV